MKFSTLTIVFALFACSSDAFAPTHSLSSMTNARLIKMQISNKNMPEMPDFSGMMDNVDLSSISKNKDQIISNLVDGEFGSRGEIYVAAQFGLILCIALGGIPVVGDFLMLLLGPGLLVAGVAAIILGVTGLGGSLSPWPVPNQGTSLVIDGIYEQMRHPIYAGLLASGAGLSIVTGSATRLFLTALLWYVLDLKTAYEEDEMKAKFPGDYEIYIRQVPSKFIPTAVSDLLPWNSNDDYGP